MDNDLHNIDYYIVRLSNACIRILYTGLLIVWSSGKNEMDTCEPIRVAFLEWEDIGVHSSNNGV